jgi:hypothetical protein
MVGVPRPKDPSPAAQTAQAAQTTPTVPTKNEAADLAAKKQETQRKNALGRAETILTTDTTLQEAANIGRKTLLGG